MIRAVIDTNIFVSAIGWGGLPFEIIELWKNNRFTLAISLEIIEEIEKTIKKLSLSETTWLKLRRLVFERAALIEIKHKINIELRDPQDIKFIECAVWGGAAYIVTGDKDLLELRKYQNIDIVNPRKFISCLI